MYEPLVELPPEGGVPTVDWLGEIAGSLFGGDADALASFAVLGGAKYSERRLANARVLSWGAMSSRDRRAPSYMPGWVSFLKELVTRPASAVIAPLSTYFPLLRLCFPYAVPQAPFAGGLAGSGMPRFLSSGARGPERATCIALHPHRMILAAAVDEGNDTSRILVYDIATEREICTLTHAFQRRVESLAWKPFAKDTLAVGCVGGVLMWNLSFTTPKTRPTVAGSSSPSGINGVRSRDTKGAKGKRDANRSAANAADEYDDDPLTSLDRTACCVYYGNGDAKQPASTLAFSCIDGRYLAVGSRSDARIFIHDIRRPPQCSLQAQVVTLVGGSEQLLFSDDDTFLVQCPSSGLPRLVLIDFPSCCTRTVATTEPVAQIVPMRGMGPNHFALRMVRQEGILVAHVHPSVGVEIVSVISTGISRGIGGSVIHVACSFKRLFLQLETGHLLVCHYGRRWNVTLVPVGVVIAEDTRQLAVFDGFTRGTLLSILTNDDTVRFFPLYHAL